MPQGQFDIVKHGLDNLHGMNEAQPVCSVPLNYNQPITLQSANLKIE